jgi:predicted DNA-binding transcriptional regulator YafY
MPNTKNYSTRLRVLDQCLRSGHAYSGKELTDFINRELELRGEPTITSRTTLMDDLLNIENEYHTNIIRKKHGRQTTYQYEDPNFSIFSNELSEDDILHLGQALDILRRFDGMPEASWISELGARLNLCMNNRKEVRAAVGFESAIYNKGMEHFTPLFNAIRKKTTVELRYQSFKMQEPQTLIVHPYYLKQYNNRWFLFCCNGDYTNLSNYPLDRILSVKLAHVPYRETDINFDEYFEDVIGVTKREGQQSEKVLLRFPKNEYPYVATKPWHGSQKKVAEDECSVTIELDIVINFELEQKILSWGDFVEVLQPLLLREMIKSRLDSCKAIYD